MSGVTDIPSPDWISLSANMSTTRFLKLWSSLLALNRKMKPHKGQDEAHLSLLNSSLHFKTGRTHCCLHNTLIFLLLLRFRAPEESSYVSWAWVSTQQNLQRQISHWSHREHCISPNESLFLPKESRGTQIASSHPHWCSQTAKQHLIERRFFAEAEAWNSIVWAAAGPVKLHKLMQIKQAIKYVLQRE